MKKKFYCICPCTQSSAQTLTGSSNMTRCPTRWRQTHLLSTIKFLPVRQNQAQKLAELHRGGGYFSSTTSRYRSKAISVTRFGEISPLWQKFTSFSKFLTVQYLFGKMLSLPTLANLWRYWANGQIAKNNLNIWSHWKQYLLATKLKKSI